MYEGEFQGGGGISQNRIKPQTPPPVVGREGGGEGGRGARGS